MTRLASVIRPVVTAAVTPAFAAAAPFRAFARPRLLHASAFCQRPSLSMRHQAPKVKNNKRPRSLVAPPGSPEPRRIAVVGAGLAGLAVAYHLTHSVARYARKRAMDPNALRVTVIDPYPPGTAGASAAAAGLLHDFAPRPKRKAWHAAAAFDAALHLLDAVAAPVHVESGLLRVSRSARDDDDFAIAAHRFPGEVELLGLDALAARFPHVAPVAQALYIRRGRVVDTPAYLRALWNTVAASGRAAFRTARVDDLHSLYARPVPAAPGDAVPDEQFDGPFDTVVLAAGAALPTIAGLPPLPQTSSRGANLVLRSSSRTPPNIPLLATGYVVPHPFGDLGPAAGAVTARVLVGTTRTALPEAVPTTPARRDSLLPDEADAMRVGIDRLAPDMLNTWEIDHAVVGERALPRRTPQGSIPIACQLAGAPDGTSAWMISGMAGRGLLYHAYLGRVVAHAVVAGNERLIPPDARRFDLALVSPREIAETEQLRVEQGSG